jgi:hypothetical protein
MPGFKSILTCCLLLLFMSIPHEPVIAQLNEPKMEAGAHFTALGGGGGYWLDGPTTVGVGGRLTFNLMRYLAFEGELNYFLPTGFNGDDGLQGQFGVKSGLRFERFGVFGKARPGFVNRYGTAFSMDIGGVLEFYPSRRMIVRFDAGDTIVHRGAAPFILTDRLFAAPRWNYATHNLQLGAGIGFRF